MTGAEYRHFADKLSVLLGEIQRANGSTPDRLENLVEWAMDEASERAGRAGVDVVHIPTGEQAE
jgi:hypothetical protein